MTFLPPDYQAPKSSNNYMKLQDGENKIRILSQPIFGWEDWVENKPVRYRFNQKPAKSNDPKKPIRHFWCFIVWNYQEERIQILNITQATIRSNIETLCKDADWGDPYFYDIKIIRKGEGTDTEYMVNPLPHRPATPRMIEAFKESPCHLDALFDNADPFSNEWPIYTQGIFDKKELPVASDGLSDSQKQELQSVLKSCDGTFKIQLLKHVQRANPEVTSLEQIPASLFDRIKNAVTQKQTEEVHA